MDSNVVTATQMKNNFGHYLEMVIRGTQIIVTKKGKEVARIIPKDQTLSFITDSLIGVILGDIDFDALKTEGLEEKYGSID